MVRTPYLNGPGHIKEIFYVAVNSDSEALKLVKARINHLDEEVTVLGPLSPTIVEFMHMKVMEVKAFGE